jgi:hypothetical protein
MTQAEAIAILAKAGDATGDPEVRSRLNAIFMVSRTNIRAPHARPAQPALRAA